jgi:peptidyl-prolyl cis-trans isomerase C
MNQILASHILVGTDSQALALKAELDKGANFEQLAMQHSTCPSKQFGGSLGFFGPGKMVKEFEAAAYSTEVGHVSNPIKTQFGYHLIKRIY